jgi:preprotein translocase subunit SecF
MASFSDFGNNLYTGKQSINFVGRRRIWYLISAALIVLSILIPVVRGGFSFGIEFTGGSEFVVSNVSNTDQSIAIQAVHSVAPEGAPKISSIGDNSVRIQTQQLTPDENFEIRQALATDYTVPLEDVTASFIGASWGADITQQALRALVVFILLAAVLMALYFRTWKMSLVI